MLPLLVAVALAVGQVLAAGVARELAADAAQAGAMAIVQGSDPRAAARAAVPGWSRGGMAVSVDGRDVAVTLRPPSPLPAVADLLAAHADASAGP
jgi:hypothetical protein